MFSVVSVGPSVCLSVCVSVQTITFESLHIWTSFLVFRYILTISRSSLSIKVIGSRSRSCAKNDYSLISTCYSFVCAYRLLIRSRSHIKVKIKIRSFLRRDTLTRVVCIWIKCVLVIKCYCHINGFCLHQLNVNIRCRECGVVCLSRLEGLTSRTMRFQDLHQLMV